MWLVVNQGKITWHVRHVRMKRLNEKSEREGRCAEIFPDKYCFRFPLLWLWNLTLDRSTWLLFSFVLDFLHWIGAAQRPSFINQFVVVVVQLKAAHCRIHLRPIMDHYRLAKVLRDVKALQTCKKSANGFENLLLQGLASHSENF